MRRGARERLRGRDRTHRVGRRGRGHDSRARQPVGEEGAHCPVAWGWEWTVRISSGAIGSPATRQYVTRCTSSPTITTSGASNTSASSVAPTPPSREFSIGTSARSALPSCTAATAAATVGRASGSQSPRGGDERVVRVRSRGPEVGGAHQSSSTTVPRSPASARRIASSSSGDRMCSPRPSSTCLQYSRAVSR